MEHRGGGANAIVFTSHAADFLVGTVVAHVDVTTGFVVGEAHVNAVFDG